MATLLQAVGAVTFAVGLAMIWLPLGIIAGGVMTTLFGIALERRNVE